MHNYYIYKQNKQTMKTLEFIAEKRYESETIFYYTKIDGHFVSDSGSHNRDVAYEKFTYLSNGGSLEPTQTILETKTI